MNIKEIILKTSHEESEILYVIEEYIFERKSVKVEINNLKGLNVNNIMHQMLYKQRINMALKAFDVAAAWLLKNKYNG